MNILKIIYNITMNPLSPFDPLKFPKLEKHINDSSGVLPPDKKDRLDNFLSEHEKLTTEQVVVVLFPHRNGNELLDIGLKLFNENGIGMKGKNNGLLLIISTEEKKIRIITGKGMELKYTEMRCRDIIENKLRPLLMAEEYGTLIEVFYSSLNETQESLDTEISGINAVEIFRKEESRMKLFVGGLVLAVIGIPLSVILLPHPLNVATIMLFFGIAGMVGSFMVLRHKGFSYKVFGIILLLISSVCIIPSLKTYSCYGKTDAGCQVYIESYNSNPNSTRGNSYGGYDSHSDWGSDSSSSDWDSGGSSFDGGGGLSNGGGYGD
ncbi:MAG: hypothetical protein HHAS10_06390 [Candidatus Altimarinota bacterium]